MKGTARGIAWVLLAVAGFGVLLPIIGARPARAHVAIRLDILEPQPDEVVGRNPTVVVFAQPMLAGAEGVNFVPTLDGVSIDPDSGATVTAPRPVEIRAREERRLFLRSLGDGEHTLTLSYSPDVDAEPTSTSVTFRVGSAGATVTTGLIAGLIALAAVMVVIPVWRRRSARRRDRPVTAPH